MKLLTHEKPIKPESMTLGSNPMCIWLDRKHELRIEKGDTLQPIADVIEDHWGLGNDAARQLAAFWFAIGARVHTNKLGAPWSKAELSVQAGRQYLKR